MSYCLCTLYMHCGTGVVCVATVNISSYSNYATTDNLPCIPTCGGSCSSFWSVHEPSVNHVCLKMADLQYQLGHASANALGCDIKFPTSPTKSRSTLCFIQCHPLCKVCFSQYLAPWPASPHTLHWVNFYLKLFYKTFTSHNHHCCVHNQVYVCMYVCMCVCVYVHVCLYMCVCMYMCVCVYAAPYM